MVLLLVQPKPPGNECNQKIALSCFHKPFLVNRTTNGFSIPGFVGRIFKGVSYLGNVFSFYTTFVEEQEFELQAFNPFDIEID